MQTVHVFIEVKPDRIEDFKSATIANARESRKEPGVIRFDFFQEANAPAKFLLIEAYKDAHAPELHRQTAHYQTWRDTVEEMMAQPRSRIQYVDLFPSDEL